MCLVWRYFTLQTTKARQQLASVSRDGRNVVSYSAVSLFKHLDKFHVNEHQQFLLTNSLTAKKTQSSKHLHFP